MALPRLSVLGAGAIGCYVGGVLAAAGHRVTFIGRASLAGKIQANGLHLTAFNGLDLRPAPDSYLFATNAKPLAASEIIIVTVKSKDTEAAARDIAQHASRDALIISLQNGLNNADVLRQTLGEDAQVIAAMVPFNVVNYGNGHFHQGTDGAIMMEPNNLTTQLCQALSDAGIPARTHTNMPGVMWGKLLLNLNNAVNTLSDRPLKEQLSKKGYRRVLAACISEALSVLKTAGIEPEQVGKVPPNVLVKILRTPDWLFTRLARQMLKIDDKARSSMWEDLQAGRPPEIDQLNGEVIRLGEKVGVETPANRKMVAAVKAAFEAGQSPGLGPTEMQKQILG